VWVVPVSASSLSPPQPVNNTVNDQEAINRDSWSGPPASPQFPPNIPRYARPASPHSGGVNVAYCGGQGEFLRDDIDYTVYQRLMTPNGRKCVDPASHSPVSAAMKAIQNLAPLAEKDYK